MSKLIKVNKTELDKMILSENKDQKFVINYRLNNNLKYFINGKKLFRSYKIV